MAETATDSAGVNDVGIKPIAVDIGDHESAEDAALFEKHFGKLGDDDLAEEPKEKTKKAADKKTPAKTEKKEAKTEKKEAKADTKAKPEAEEKPAVKTDKKKDDETEDEPGDDSPKAKETYKKAKASKNPSDARKLYRQAMKEAFGEVPDEFNDQRFAAARKADQERETKHTEKAAALETRIKEATVALTPAITVMKALKASGLHEKLEMKHVERTISFMRALRDVENGDYPALGAVIAKALDKPIDEAMRLFTRGVKESPEAKIAREAKARAAEVETAANERIAALERRLEEREAGKDQAAKQARRETQLANHLTELSSELADHPVAKLKDGFARVQRFIIKTADRKLKAPKYTFEEAADRIVASEKLRVRNARHLLEDDGEEQPERPEPAHATPRSQTRATGTAKEESDEERFDRIYRKHNPAKRR